MTAVIDTDRFTHKHTSLFIRLTDIPLSCVISLSVDIYIVHSIVFYHYLFMHSHLLSIVSFFMYRYPLSSIVLLFTHIYSIAVYCFTVCSLLFYYSKLLHYLFIASALSSMVSLFNHNCAFLCRVWFHCLFTDTLDTSQHEGCGCAWSH